MVSVCSQWIVEHIVRHNLERGRGSFRKACDNRAVVHVSIKLLH